MQGCRTPGSLTLSDKAWGINTVNHKCMHIHLIPMGLCDIEYVSRGRRGIGFSKEEGQTTRSRFARCWPENKSKAGPRQTSGGNSCSFLSRSSGVCLHSRVPSFALSPASKSMTHMFRCRTEDFYASK